ncbi:hypothetical protein ABVT39_008422 [Epinephelus coioides]
MATRTQSNRLDIDAIAESILQKQRDYFEPLLSQIQQVGKDTDEKLSAIQAELATLTAGLGTIRSDIDALKTTVGSNSSTLNGHGQALQAMELKLADMEDRNRRCNIRITGLEEGLEGSNIEIMRAHRIYNNNARNRGANRTLIFNVLRYPTRQAILHAARKDPLSINGRRIRFSPDYSNFTVKRRQSFRQAIDTARAKGLDFFLLYPATLKIKDGAQYKAYTSPKEAEDFLASVPAPCLETLARDDDASSP